MQQISMSHAAHIHESRRTGTETVSATASDGWGDDDDDLAEVRVMSHV